MASDFAGGPAGPAFFICCALAAMKVSLSFDFSLWLRWTPET
jgi:hypothetical protein